MVKDEHVGPRFFRILVPGFATKLPIPHTFMKHVMKDKNREKATLVNSAGKTWHVDLCKISGDVCFGGEGWEEFVHTHNLSSGYMLVFRYRGNMVFRFRIYGLNSCEELRVRYNRKPANESSDSMAHGKEQSYNSIPKTRRHTHNKKKTVETKNRSSSKGKEEAPDAKGAQFEAIITAANLKYRFMPVPATFRISTGLSVNDKDVILMDPEGRIWYVGLAHGKNHKVLMQRGWIDVANANNFRVGERYIFQMLSRKKDEPMRFQIVKVLSV